MAEITIERTIRYNLIDGDKNGLFSKAIGMGGGAFTGFTVQVFCSGLGPASTGFVFLLGSNKATQPPITDFAPFNNNYTNVISPYGTIIDNRYSSFYIACGNIEGFAGVNWLNLGFVNGGGPGRIESIIFAPTVK